MSELSLPPSTKFWSKMGFAVAAAGNERIVSLQVLRFIAATGVISLHAWQVFGNSDLSHLGLIGEFGPAGVDLFFVLSGFIITSVSAGQAPKSFFKRRLTRILPLYWAATCVMMLLYFSGGIFDPHRMLPSFLFVPTLGYSSYIIVGWTLCFEVLFYLCFSLILFSPKRILPGAIAAYLAALVAREIFGGPLFQFVGNPIILEFLAGCLVAFLPRSRRATWLAAVVAMTGGALILGTGYEAGAHQSVFEGDGIWVRLVMWGVPAFFLVYCAVQVRVGGRFWQALAYLGDASYAAYLVHEIILILMNVPHIQMPPPLIASVVVLLSWGLAILVHEGFEKPVLKFLRRP